MKFGRIVLQASMHQLTESDFWCDVILSRWGPWRPPAARCCICSCIHQPHANPCSASDVTGSLYALQFLIHSTFILVIANPSVCHMLAFCQFGLTHCTGLLIINKFDFKFEVMYIFILTSHCISLECFILFILMKLFV